MSTAGWVQTVDNVLKPNGVHKVLAGVRDTSAEHSVLDARLGI